MTGISLYKKNCKTSKNYVTFAQIFNWIVMFAIVNIAGQQFRVTKDQELFVNRLGGNAGDKVEFSDVLLSSNDGKINTGASMKVQAEIIDHLKGDKVLVFKKKRRKGYKKLNGHRSYLTKIKIADIS